MRNGSLTLLLCLLVHYGLCQNVLGVPNIINYSKQQYGAGNQNWSIVQDRRGILYFANNQGLLTFDGAAWRKYALPNKTMVRSLALGPNGRIYAGGQSEFGYFEPDARGELAYTSLMPLLPETERDFTDVWNICIYDGQVFFRSYKKILAWDGRRVRAFNDVHWNFMGVHPKGLLAYEYQKRLVAYRNGTWQPVLRGGALPEGVILRSVLDLGGDSLLLVSLLHGLFVLRHDTVTALRSPFLSELAGQNIYGATLLDRDRIALITNLSGCVVIDRAGRFQERFTKKEGIQNNNILSVLLDKDRNLWLGLDNGIDLITYNNALKSFFPEPDDRNSGYASLVHGGKLYLGLSSGAYVADLGPEADISRTRGAFRPVAGSKGQVWGFAVVNGRLLMGHNSGAYELRGDVAVPVDKKTGFWDFQPLPVAAAAPVVLAGTYNGINFYYDKGSALVNPRVHAHFESARFVVVHRGVIWVAHPYKGLYQVRFSAAGAASYERYPDRSHILSTNHNKIFALRGQLVLTNDNGIFTWDEGRGDFVRNAELERMLGGGRIAFLRADAAGRLWFCRDRRVGVVDPTRPSEGPLYIPELNDRILSDGFEQINIIDSNNVLIAAEKGVFHLNYVAYRKSRRPLQVLIRSVRLPLRPEDDLLFGGYSAPPTTPSVAYRHNALQFECAATLYGQEHNTEFRYFLEGFDKGWSEWQRRTDRGYTNLPPGRYRFRVKCRNHFNNESAEAVYAFTVLPPWYRTWWAWAAYALLAGGALYLFYAYQQRRHRRIQQEKLRVQQARYEEEQRHLQMHHQLELEQNEKQIIRLRNEKLQAEIEQKKLQEEQERLQWEHRVSVERSEREIVGLRNEKLESEVAHKNSELASAAMNMVRKMEILTRLREDLVQFKEAAGIGRGPAEKEFAKILKVLDKELDPAEDWEQFARHFDSVHTNYLQKLKEFCPDLSASELKLAAYLRLNLSSKEIAQLMSISTRGVETSRYRLRKKLGLKGEENLFDFLIRIGAR